jgi:hypothetical protein
MTDLDERLKKLEDGFLEIIFDKNAHIAELEADARLADMAWNDNQAALKAQAAEIATLKLIIQNAKLALSHKLQSGETVYNILYNITTALEASNE